MATEPFVGEIHAFGFNFAPRNWALCAGQLMAISQNTALFSLLGTTYGGDGRTTFGLPDFQGRTPLGMGQGPGRPNYDWGEKAGGVSTTLQAANLPPHTHGLSLSAALPAHGGPGSQDNPVAAVPAGSAAVENYSPPGSANASLGGGTANLTAQSTGSGVPFGRMPPYRTLNICIALFGVYPSRT